MISNLRLKAILETLKGCYADLTYCDGGGRDTKNTISIEKCLVIGYFSEGGRDWGHFKFLTPTEMKKEIILKISLGKIRKLSFFTSN